MESIMTKTRCNMEVHELSLAELELVSGGLIHEGSHAGAGAGPSVLRELANAMAMLMQQELERQQNLR